MDFLYNQEKQLKLLLKEKQNESYQQGEKNKQREIAKEMKKDQVSIEVIMKYTHLSKDEIEEL